MDQDFFKTGEGVYFGEQRCQYGGELSTNESFKSLTGGTGQGVSGASWSVTFLDDHGISGNGLMRMRASTAGSDVTTMQSQITHDGNYLRGTYTARMTAHYAQSTAKCSSETAMSIGFNIKFIEGGLIKSSS